MILFLDVFIDKWVFSFLNILIFYRGFNDYDFYVFIIIKIYLDESRYCYYYIWSLWSIVWYLGKVLFLRGVRFLLRGIIFNSNFWL